MILNRIKRALNRKSKHLVETLTTTYRRLRNGILRYFVPNTDDEDSTHVTTSNLEDHRREILEKARRHVKPQTPTNSHVVRNSIVVGGVSLTVVLMGLYVSVYRLQPTNNFYYQLSQLLPISVGEIADQNINYDRVLFYFRAESRADSFELSENVVDKDNDKRQRLERSFINARESVYVEALAEARGVSVSDEEVLAIISDLPLLESGSADLDVVLQEFRGWTRDDLFRETRIEALKSSEIVPNLVVELSQATTGDDYGQLSQTLKEVGAEVGNVSDIEEPPQLVRQTANQLDGGDVSEVVEVGSNLYVLFEGSDNTRYVLVNSGLRKQLIEAQATEATSRSCLSGLSFSATDVQVSANSGFMNCIF